MNLAMARESGSVGFTELNEQEMTWIDGGGDVVGFALAIVSAASGALVSGFVAGRAFVRDLRNKF